MLLAAGATSLGDWVSLATAVCGAAGAALGLPPLIASRRARKAQGAIARRGPRLVLPSRIQLVDRVDELSEILRYLRAGEFVVTVEGAIGVGKSALAMEAAHQLAAGGRRSGRTSKITEFESLVWIDAANQSPDLSDLARTLSLVTGERSLSAAPTIGKAEALRSFLAEHPTVLVIDNLRVPVGTTAVLPNFLRTLPSGSIAIVSANTVGAVHGPQVQVPELPRKDATALTVREASRRGVTALADPAGELVERAYQLVGGNPRAIGLLVLACSRFPGAVSGLLDQLASGSNEIAAALYETVWSELPPTGRDALTVCAYVVDGADLEQVAISLGIAEVEIHPVLGGLWADGLLGTAETMGRTVYVCSPVLRAFTSAKGDPGTLARVRTRLGAYLAQRFTADWEDAAGAVRHVGAIRTLVRDLDACGEYRLCLDLFTAVYDILFTLGLFDDRIELGWVAYHAAGELGLPEEQSLALSVVSSTHAIRGEDAKAAAAVKLGLQIARQAGSARETARQLRCEGFRLFRAGHAAEALAVVESEDAENMARSAGDLNNMIDILSLVGAARWHLGDLDGCEATVRRFVQECESMPWERGKAYALRDLAEVMLMRRDYAQAQKLTSQARRIAEEYRDVRQAARIALTESRLHLFGGRMRAARDTAWRAAGEARTLLLAGERAEADAVARIAERALRMPWLRVAVTRQPQARFTEMTVGGD